MRNTLDTPAPSPASEPDRPAPERRSAPRTVSVLSFRGGTGKTNLVANVAWLAARRGGRVALVDTDLRSPGAHVVLGVDGSRLAFTLTDFVGGHCELREAALDVSSELEVREPGRLVLVPGRVRLDALTSMAEEGHDPQRLHGALAALREQFPLDLVLIDSRPGLNPQSLVTAPVSDLWMVLVRDDAQDLEGTRVLVEAAERIGLAELLLVPTMTVDDADGQREFVERLVESFGRQVAAPIPRTAELAALGSAALFARKHPEHALTQSYAQLADLARGAGADRDGR